MKKLLVLMAFAMLFAGVAQAAEEYILVGLYDKIIKLDTDGAVIDATFIVDPTHLSRVGGLDVKDGVLYASSRHTGGNTGEISKYNLADGTYIGQFAELLTCESIKRGPDGNLYGAGRDASRVKGWDDAGTEIFDFATNNPWGVDFDNAGYLYTVANGGVNQFKKVLMTDSSVVSDYAPYPAGKTYYSTVAFAPNGVLYGFHDSRGICRILPGSATTVVDNLGGLGMGIDVFPDGKLYVPKGGQQRVDIFDPSDNSLTTWVDSLGQECNSVLYVGGEAPPVPTEILAFSVSDQTSGSTAKTNEATVDVSMTVSTDTAAGVTIVAYIVDETPGTPLTGDPDWVGTLPPTYTITGGEGTVTMYGWVKDSAGAIVGTTHDIVYATPVAWEGDYALIGLNDTIMKVEPDGTVIDASFIVDSRLQGVRGMTIKDDVLYVGNAGIATVEKYDLATGDYIAKFAQADAGWRSTEAVNLGPDGNIYVAWRNWERVKGFDTDGNEVFSYVGGSPWGMDFSGGYLYTVHNGQQQFKKVLMTDSSVVSDYAPYPAGKTYYSTVAFAPNGVLYGFHDSRGICRILPGSATTVVGSIPGFGPGVEVFGDGKIYIPGGGANLVHILDPSDDSSLTTWVDSLPQACHSVLWVGAAPPVAPTEILAFSVSDQTSGSTSKTNDATVDVSMTVSPGVGATVTGYILTETPGEPALGSPDWVGALPATYTITGGEGTVTVYGWVKDDLGTVAGETTQILYAMPVPWEGDYVLIGLSNKIIKRAPNGDVIDDGFIIDADHLSRVGGLAVKDGVLYASSRHTGPNTGEISKYDLATGEYMGQFAELFTCEAIKLGPDGNIYGAGRDSSVVKGWDAGGNVVFSFATNNPWGMDFDGLGYLYTVANGGVNQYKKVLMTNSAVVENYAPYPDGKTYYSTVAFAADGTLYGFHDSRGIAEILPGSSTTVVGSLAGLGVGINLFPDGMLYVPMGGQQRVDIFDTSDNSLTTWVDSLGQETNSVLYVDTTPGLEITEFIVTDRTSGSSGTTNERAVNVSLTAVPPPGETILGYKITETPDEPAFVDYRPVVTSHNIQAGPGPVTLYAWAIASSEPPSVVMKATAILYDPSVMEGVVLVGLDTKIIKLSPDGSMIDPSFIVDPDHLSGVRGLAVLDGVLYAGSAGDATVEMYILETGEYEGKFAQADAGWRHTEAVNLGPDGNIYVAWRNWETVKGFAPDGTEVFNFVGGSPWGMDFDDAGYLYTVHNGQQQFKKVLMTDSSVVEDYAPYPAGKTYYSTVVFGPDGTLYGMHDSRGIARILPGSSTTIVDSLPGFGPGVDVFPDGKIYIPGGGTQKIFAFDPFTEIVSTWKTDLGQQCHSVLFLGVEAPRWPIPGDANGDCKVNILDMIFIRNRLNQDPGTDENWRADVTEDGNINILDMIYVRNRLNTSCPE